MKILARLFATLVRLRNWLYDRGWLPAHRAAVPVVSAGSLAAGGAGKTSLAALIAERLVEMGRRPAILSRGYRSRLERRGGRVSPGDDALWAGDEPVLLARRLAPVPVYAGRRRDRSAALAIAGGADVLVLDDGFQHRRLRRDLDAVIVDAGAEALDLLPAGPLREPPSSLARAHLVVLRGEGPPPPTWSGPVVRVADEAFGLHRHPGGEALGLEALRGRQVTLVAGIARPERFAALARALGAEPVEERFFPDHHFFSPRDLADPRAEILVTEKDAVRLPAGLEALVLAHRLRVVEGEEILRAALDRALGGNP
jgi:tetraacyldisaccharide 4'-kinase